MSLIDRAVHSLGVLLFVCVLAPTATADEVGDWLMRINDAERGLNYEGTFVYVHGDMIEAMRVVHQGDGDSNRQRIYALNGSPREIIRDAEQIWCYVPDQKIGVHEHRQASKASFPHLLPERLQELRESYQIVLGGHARIADRRARQLTVSPRDVFRYGYDLWADVETGLLLKAVLLDGQSRPIEQYVFVDLSIGGQIDDSALAPRTPKQQLVWFGSASDEKTKPNSVGNWRVTEVPDGFVMSQSIRRMSPMRQRMMEHYVYSDGLAAVSVFVEKMNGQKTPILGLNSMGAIHAFGNVVEDYQITVVGEVPAQTVSLMGMSVTRR